MDLKKIKKIHIIGIEGAGTSALACLLRTAGKEISGSDEGDHFYNATLCDAGVKVYRRFDPANIAADADLIVYSTAHKPETNPELKSALDSKKPVIKYAEALGALMADRYTIAVCGSHGKTTTTAWLAYVLDQAGLSPSAIVGSRVAQWGSGSLSGKSDYLVVEADEYQNKLKYYKPRAVLINNIDYDHPDFFPTVEDYERVFIEFIKQAPTKGFVVANFDDPVVRSKVPVNCRAKVISYSLADNADYIAYDIKTVGEKQYFKVKLGAGWDYEEDGMDAGEHLLGDFTIRLFGRHNVSNALAVIAAAIELNVPLHALRSALDDFSGTDRRMELIGDYRGASIYRDYAHHPTEIRATLSAVREVFPDRRLIAVFQPHTFTRTKALLQEFAGSFSAADETIVTDIYGSAREKQGGVHSRDLVEAMNSIENTGNSPSVKYIYVGKGEEVEAYLRQSLKTGDIVIFMGAGDGYQTGEILAK